MTRVPALGFKPANSDGIPEAYHLVQKKIILDREHLLTNGMVAAQPDVDLLRNGRIEPPSSIVIAH